MSYTVGDIDRMRFMVAQLINWERFGGPADYRPPSLERCLEVEHRLCTYIAAGTTLDELDARLTELIAETEERRRQEDERERERYRQEQQKRAREAPIIVECPNAPKPLVWPRWLFGGR